MLFVALCFFLAALCSALNQEDVERRAPWFCHDRDCPRFKTVRAAATGLERLGARQE